MYEVYDKCFQVSKVDGHNLNLPSMVSCFFLSLLRFTEMNFTDSYLGVCMQICRTPPDPLLPVAYSPTTASASTNVANN